MEIEPTTWSGIERHLRSVALSTVGGSSYPWDASEWKTLPGLIELLFCREEISRSRVSSLATEISNTGRIVQASPQERFWLSLRIACAIDFLQEIATSGTNGHCPMPEPGNRESTSELLRWLLIQIWLRRREHWLKLFALNVCTGLPFYGVSPASGEP